MSSMSEDDQVGREEEDQQPQEQTPLQGGRSVPFPEEDDDGDEEEAVTKVCRCWCWSLLPESMHGLR